MCPFLLTIVSNNLIEEKSIDENHYLWIHLDKFSLDVGAIYKPERTNYQSFFEIYAEQLRKRKKAVTIGDFNYDLLTTDKNTIEYKDMLKENGYKIINKIDNNTVQGKPKQRKQY